MQSRLNFISQYPSYPLSHQLYSRVAVERSVEIRIAEAQHGTIGLKWHIEKWTPYFWKPLTCGCVAADAFFSRKMPSMFLESPTLWLRCRRRIFSQKNGPIFLEAPNLWARCRRRFFLSEKWPPGFWKPLRRYGKPARRIYASRQAKPARHNPSGGLEHKQRSLQFSVRHSPADFTKPATFGRPALKFQGKPAGQASPSHPGWPMGRIRAPVFLEAPYI